MDNPHVITHVRHFTFRLDLLLLTLLSLVGLEFGIMKATCVLATVAPSLTWRRECVPSQPRCGESRGRKKGERKKKTTQQPKMEN
jgi:hypothetical protein